MSNLYCYIYSRNTRLRRDFPRPPGERHLRRHLWVPSVPPLGRLRHPFGKKKIGAPWAPPISGASGAPAPQIGGAHGAPNIYFFFSPTPKAAASQMGAGGAPTEAPLPRRVREIPPKAGISRVFENISDSAFISSTLINQNAKFFLIKSHRSTLDRRTYAKA